MIDEADKRNRGESRIELPGYIYPRNVLCVQDFDLAKHGQSLCFPMRIFNLHELWMPKRKRQGHFGGGFLLSEAAAAKKSKAEEAALEVMSARFAAISESQQNSRMSADEKSFGHYLTAKRRL